MKRIGIIGAMRDEVEYLQKEIENPGMWEKSGMVFVEGKLDGIPVVVVQCGAGKVNSAICTQILIDLFDVTHIINTGVAGSLADSVNYYDVVISTEVCYHDMHNEAMGYQPGEPPRAGWLLYEADDDLIAWAEAACEKVFDNLKPSYRPQVHKGRILTGDWFINSAERKASIVKKFGGLCTEMEGAAIGHCAYLGSIPFVVIRSISDKADDAAHDDFHELEEEAAYRSAVVVREMIQLIE